MVYEHTIRDIKHMISRLIGHRHVFLTERGNKAILLALRASKKINPKKFVLIPDQGGWLTYRNFPLKAGLTVRYLKTDHGLIDPADIDLKDVCALIYANPAGYFAEQDAKGIYKKCKERSVVIMDVSGSIGDKKLCKGRYADICLGSFGKGKPVDFGMYGFISFKHKPISPVEDAVIENPENLLRKIKNVKQRIRKLYSVSKQIKEDLSDMDIVHPEKKGINVVVRFSSEKEKSFIKRYCEKHLYEYTICPRYIRINSDAISIEVKRMCL